MPASGTQTEEVVPLICVSESNCWIIGLTMGSSAGCSLNRDISSAAFESRKLLLPPSIERWFCAKSSSVVIRLGSAATAVGDLLREVLGQVADALVGVLAPEEHALRVELRAEPGHVPGLIMRPDSVQRVLPRLEDFPGSGVEVVAAILIPDRQMIPVEDHGVGGGPPHLVVRGGQVSRDIGTSLWADS